MMHVSAIWAALFGLATMASAQIATAAAGASDDGVGQTSRVSAASAAASPHARRSSVRGAASSIKHQRRRKGSGVPQANKAASLEVVGPRGGHASTKARLAKPAGKTVPHRVARVLPAAGKGPCLHEPVDFERGFGGDVQSLVLTRCDGRPAPHALEQLSVMVRPMSAPKPMVPTIPIRHGESRREWLPGIKLVHEG